MELGRKKIKSNFFSKVINAIKAFGYALKKIFWYKKRILEISLVFLLLILGMAAFLTLSRDKEETALQFDYINKELNEGINAYRLEDFNKAEILLSKIYESTKRKKVKSRSALYLGNIYYKMNNFGKAVHYYQKSYSFDKKNVYALYNSALASLKVGNSQRALKYSKKAFEIEKTYLPNRILLGNRRCM